MTQFRLIPLAALFAAGGIVFAQPGPPKKDAAPAKKEVAKDPAKPAPGSLEDTLEKALRNSADIKAAEAKVRDAEAELNRVRQQVLTKATALHADLNLAKRMSAVAEQSLAIQERMAQTGQASVTDRLTAQAMVEKHRGEVEKLEAELKSLRGEFAIKGVSSVAFSPDGRAFWAANLDGTVRVWDVDTGAAWIRDFSGTADAFRPVPLGGSKGPGPAVQTPMMDRVRRLLDQEVDASFEATEVSGMIRAILDQAKADIPLRVTLPEDGIEAVRLKGKLPVGAWLQAAEDADPKVRLVVRDYGLLLTTSDRVPDGALRVQDLWKGNYAEIKPKKAEEKKP